MIEHEAALLRYATRILNSPVAAQDVVQNVFIKLLTRWDQGLRPGKGLKSWLYRVTHNEAVDQLRAEARRRLLLQKRAEAVQDECSDGGDCQAAHDERRQLVLQHLRRLHPREQQIVLLRLEEGLSYREISEVTGRSVGNVGNILHHAVCKLSARLEQAEAI